MPVENTEIGSRVKKRLWKYNALQITTNWKSYTSSRILWYPEIFDCRS